MNLNEVLIDIEQALADLQASDPEQYEEAGEAIFRLCYELGRVAADAGTREANASATREKIAAFVARAEPILRTHTSRLARFYIDTTDLLEREWEWGEEWQSVCQRWSCGQFIRELFSGTAFIETLQMFAPDDEYLDELRSQGRRHGPIPRESVPSGIPRSHWWWWYPAPHPGGSSR